MARRDTWLQFGPLKGENTSQNPLVLDAQWAQATSNVILDPESSVAVKRRGSRVMSDTPAGTYLLARFKPAQAAEADAELWAFALDPGLKAYRRPGTATVWTPVVVPAELTLVMRTVTLNGKLFLAGRTTINRMFCWDGTAIRKVGILATVAPGVAEIPGGDSHLRWYKVSWRRRDAVTGAIQAESELSPSIQYKPSGATNGAKISRPAVPEQATHWIVWASMDGTNFFKLAEQIVATTFWDDTATSYSGEVAPEIGNFLPPPSPTRLITDGHRLMMSGNGSGLQAAAAGETVPRYNRLWYTPVLGTSDRGDDERIPQTSFQRNYLDLGENTNDGTLSELAGPMDGEIYAFTRRRIWRLVPTGDLQTPYLTYPVSDRYGAEIGTTGVEVMAVTGEDHMGKPTVYFLSESGIYRLAATIQLVSFDIQPDIRATDRLNAFLFSYPQQRQLWFCTGGPAGPCRIRVFHWGQGKPDEDGDVRGGWVTWNIGGRTSGFQSAVRHNRQPGVDACMCQDLIPYLAGYAANEPISYFDRPEGIDNTTPFSASVAFAPWIATRAEKQFRIGNPVVIATERAGVQLALDAYRDFGAELRSALISLQALAHEGTPTEVVRTVEGLFSGDVTGLTLVIRDAAANAALWRVDWCAVPLTEQEPR